MVTRVTNSMLSNTLLNNLSVNLNNFDKLNNQLATGRKYAHISDDPAALIYGQAARNKLARLDHFQESVSIGHNWLTQAESGIMEMQQMIGCIYEELVNAGGSKTITDRQNLAEVVKQYKDHYVDNLNASFGDRFVFGGYNTPGDYIVPNDPTVKPFTFDAAGNLLYNGFNVSQFDGMPAEFMLVSCPKGMTQAEYQAALDVEFGGTGDPPYTAVTDAFADFNNSFTPPRAVDINAMYTFHQLRNDVISFDMGPGIEMPVTMNGLDVLFFTTYDETGSPIMRSTYELLQETYDKITEEQVITGVNPDGSTYTYKEPVYTVDDLTKLITRLQDSQNHHLVKVAEIGGRCRRLELLEARYESDAINYGSMRSDAEDADIAEVIMNMKMAETVYQAALSAGARVIQPSLMDFLR